MANDTWQLEETTDHWQLEEGGGNWILEENVIPLVADDSDSWFSNANLTAVPRAIAVASLASSVAIAGQINRHNDELLPYQPAQVASQQSYGQRAKATTRFVRWPQGDELPQQTTSLLEEQDWAPPAPRIPRPAVALIASDEEIFASGVLEENLGPAPYVSRTAASFATWPDEDVPIATVTTFVDEDSPITVTVRTERAQYVSFSDDDLPVTPTTTLVEEDYSIPVAARMEPMRAYAIVPDEEVSPVAIEEDYQTTLQAYQQALARGLLSVEDDFPQQTAATLVEEQDWWNQAIPPPPIMASVFVQTEEIFPTTPLPVDEMYWLTFQLGPDVSKVNVAWQSQFEDDMPVLSTPPPPPQLTGGEYVVRFRRRILR